MESTYISTGYKIGKRQPLDFLKLYRYAATNDMSVVHIFIINSVHQPASYICISVEHHWFSLLIRCNSDPESLKHDMSLMNT